MDIFHILLGKGTFWDNEKKLKGMNLGKPQVFRGYVHHPGEVTRVSQLAPLGNLAT